LYYSDGEEGAGLITINIDASADYKTAARMMEDLELDDDEVYADSKGAKGFCINELKTCNDL
jgi:hypothetical protein